eukprot:scaffold124085_cov33-Prasinocladus_malaysianus.AAC.1
MVLVLCKTWPGAGRRHATRRRFAAEDAEDLRVTVHVRGTFCIPSSVARNFTTSIHGMGAWAAA